MFGLRKKDLKAYAVPRSPNVLATSVRWVVGWVAAWVLGIISTYAGYKAGAYIPLDTTDTVGAVGEKVMYGGIQSTAEDVVIATKMILENADALIGTAMSNLPDFLWGAPAESDDISRTTLLSAQALTEYNVGTANLWRNIVNTPLQTMISWIATTAIIWWITKWISKFFVLQWNVSFGDRMRLWIWNKIRRGKNTSRAIDLPSNGGSTFVRK